MNAPWKTPQAGAGQFVEEVEVRGHIIDSLILPKILDSIAGGGGRCKIKEITIGQAGTTPAMPCWKFAPMRNRSCKKSSPKSPTTARCRPMSTIAASWRPTLSGPFPKISIARRTSGPKSASPATGWRSPIRKWIAGSSSTSIA